MNVDTTGWTPYADTNFNDGIHFIQYRATDNAGNITQTAPQEIKVDTTTPSLSLQITGIRGQNDWYVSSVSVAPNASDNGSGVATVEAAINNGAWTPITNNQLPLFTDGIHTYQVKVTDNAGNVTETPVLTVKVDATAPTITAPYVIGLAEDLAYRLTDPTSGLNQFSVTISDKDNIQPATGSAWGLAGNEAAGSYRWSGQFANDAIANAGLHPFALRLTDMAGNEAVLTGYIEVTRKALIYVGLIVPHNNPPSGSTGAIAYTGSSRAGTSNEIPSVAPVPEVSFGGETVVPPNEGQSITVTEGEASPFAGERPVSWRHLPI